MVIGYINVMEIYYRRFGGKGATLGGYFVTPISILIIIPFFVVLGMQFVYILCSFYLP